MIPPEQLKIEVPESVKFGGQKAGNLPTGIRVTHIPTGVSATCIGERSQMKNRDIAIAMVEYGLLELGVKP